MTDTGKASTAAQTLWVGADSRVFAYAANGSGPATAQVSRGDFYWASGGNPGGDPPGIAGMTVAPDGTLWVQVNRSFALGGRGWRLFALSPGTSRSAELYGDDLSGPDGLTLGPDGIMVGSYDLISVTVTTYPYAGGKAAAIRTFRTSSRGQLVTSNNGMLYLASGSTVDVYNATATGCCPVKSIALQAPPGEKIGLIPSYAVGPDGNMYVIDFSGDINNEVLYIDVFTDSGSVARRIGPLPAEYAALSLPVITVDSRNQLYVATKGSIYRFGPNANGNDAPLAVMTPSALDGRPSVLAVGPKL